MDSLERSGDDDRLAEFHAEYFAAPCGQRPQVVEPYCAKYPDLAPDIRKFHEMQPELDNLRQGAQEAPSDNWWENIRPGLRMGDFEIIEPIGKGGMGAVFKARQLSLKRVVALKLTRLNDAETQRRFEREREVFGELHHGSILPVFVGGDAHLAVRPSTDSPPSGGNAGHSDEGRNAIYYYAMTLVPGASLAAVVGTARDGLPASFLDAIKVAARALLSEADISTVLRDEPGARTDRDRSLLSRTKFQPGELWVRSVARCVMRLAEAIQYVHGKGWIHCDLKPANVMIEPNEHPWVIDFGLARKKDADAPSISGTPTYMAPEQFRGLADERSDVFALGEILYAMLTLETPFPDSSRKFSGDYPWDWKPLHTRSYNLPVDVVADLDAICHAAMRREPEYRYQTASALANDVRRFLDREPLSVRPWGTRERIIKWMRKNPGWSATSGMVLLFLASFVGFGIYHDRVVTKAYEQANRLVVELADTTVDLQQNAVILNNLEKQSEVKTQLAVLAERMRSISAVRPDIVPFQEIHMGMLRDLSNREENPDRQAALINEAIAIGERLLNRNDLTPRQVIAIRLNLADAINSRAVDLRRLGQVQEALDEYARSLEVLSHIDPPTTESLRSQARLRHNRAKALASAGRLTEALTEAETVSNLRREIGSSDPFNADLLSEWANSLMSVADLRFSLATLPQPLNAEQHLSKAMEESAKAMQMLDQCVKDNEHEVKFLRMRIDAGTDAANIRIAAEKYDEAKVILVQSLPFAEKLAAATTTWDDRHRLATLHAQLGQLQQGTAEGRRQAGLALELVRKLLADRPDSTAAKNFIKALEPLASE